MSGPAIKDETMWTCQVACPNCGELFHEGRLGARGADTMGRAYEGAAASLERHARDEGCDLTCGTIEFVVDGVRP